MGVTTKDDMITPQILLDAILGAFKSKTAFMGSILVSGGAVLVNGSMPQGGQKAIGKTIDMPYFGTLPAFVNNPEGSSITPSKIAMMSEQATVARSSLAVETTVWAQGVAAVNAALKDPHDEAARQAMVQATREMDKQIVAKFKATPLVRDIYNSSVGSAQYLEHRQVIRARSLWGDDQSDIVAMVTHSQAEADLAEMTDADGRPLLVDHVRDGQESVKKFAGIPLLVSDEVPLDGSTMGTVTAAGTTPPTVTLAGEPLGPYNLIIDIVVGGSSNGTATFRFSTDGGNTYSATLVVPNGGGAFVLTDTAVDSLVGKNGATGITATFANGTYNADNTYTSTANLKVSSLICQRGAGAFWFNANALVPQDDKDILMDADIMAMHLYYAAHLYRRRNGGPRPGVVALKHNVRNFVG